MVLVVDYDEISTAILQVKAEVRSNQEEIEAVYAGLAAGFTESSGDTAEALKMLGQAETLLSQEISNILSVLADSIQLAANEFKHLDSKGANSV